MVEGDREGQENGNEGESEGFGVSN